MKLCWLVPDDIGGGITPVALNCCEEAEKHGHSATLLMLREPKWVQYGKFTVASLKLESWAADAPRSLLAWLQENPQDILFFNGCGEFDSIIPYLPPSIKCVYVVHDTARTYWRSALVEEDCLESIVAVSETVADKFRRYLKRPSKLHVIHNGCLFPPSTSAETIRENSILFLGGDNPTKGAFDVLKVWSMLTARGFKGQLHWFGHMMPSFQSKISKLPASEAITVHGYVSRESIFEKASSSKVLLMLSRVEPFGMATIETMSMGCVPVAWDIETGTKEIADSGITGLFSSLGNTRSLVRNVFEVCEQYERFGTSAIQRVRKHFSSSAMWCKYSRLIAELSLKTPIERPRNGELPPDLIQPMYRFQLLPSAIRTTIREKIGRSTRLGYWLRDMRGL